MEGLSTVLGKGQDAAVVAGAVKSCIAQPSGPPGWWWDWWRGLAGLVTILAVVFGRLTTLWFRRPTEDQRSQGLVLVLPGIEARSSLSLGVCQGLRDAGLTCAIDIFDWTTGFFLLFPIHGILQGRNARQAAKLAQHILNYRRDYPGRPIWVIGHSGGGGLASLAVARLPQDVTIDGLILLAPALSPWFPLTEVSQRVRSHVWNFYSYGDVIFLGMGTTLQGGTDRAFGPAAGMVGFAPPKGAPSTLIQVCWRPAMLADWHWGGHMGWVHRVFVARHLAPLIIRHTAQHAPTENA